MSEKKESKKPNKEAPEGFVVTQEQLDEIKAKIDELTAQKDDYLQTAQRLQAEFDNFRKRTASTRAESLEEGARDAVKELLPVIDSLDRATVTVNDDPYAQGMLMVARQMMDVMTKLGLEPVVTDGEFDPEIHDALMQVEVDGLAAGQVAEVIQKGYKFKGKTIRCAMVKVAK